MAEDGPFLHLGDLSKERADKVEQPRSHEPNSNIVDSLKVDKLGQFSVRNKLTGDVWLVEVSVCGDGEQE